MVAKFSRSQIMAASNGMHKVEKGLFLYVYNNRRTWIYRYSFAGKQFKLGLGSALTVPLANAKELRNQAMALLLTGHNPMTVRQSYQRKLRSKEDVLFNDYWAKVYERLIAIKGWKNKKHAEQWKSTVEKYALPFLGNKKVKDICRDDILEVLEPIWTEKNETASRLRGRLEITLGYAVADGLIKGGNPAAWKSNLDLFLPGKSQVQERRHFAALTHSELKEKISLLKPNLYISHALILFTILTASRIGESAPARWDEIDWNKKIWAVPPERRKDKKKFPHRVPLSTQAIDLLKSLPHISEYLFPANPGNKKISGHLSKETPRVIIQRIFKDKTTMHGMRSTFRDWCAEVGIRDIVADKCLMHTVGNEVFQAYQRSDLLDQRRQVMQQWADYLLPSDNSKFF